MKILFLIGYIILDSQITNYVSKEIRKKRPDCDIEALVLIPEDIKDYPHIISKLAQAKLTVRDISDYPQNDPMAVLKSIKPDLVITTDDASPYHNSYVVAAKMGHIPILQIQAAMIGEVRFTLGWYVAFFLSALSPNRRQKYVENYRSLDTTYKKLGHNRAQRFINKFRETKTRVFGKDAPGIRGLSDKIAVSGNATRNLLIKKGIDTDKIEVTGYVRFDSLFKNTIEKDEATKEIEAKSKGKKVVLFLPDSADSHQFVSTKSYWQTNTGVIAACKELDDIQLVVKPHPGENYDTYRSIFSKLNYEATLYEGQNLHGLMKASDVIVTGISTTGLEALIFKKPLVIVKHKGERISKKDEEYIPYVSYGVALGVTEVSQLPKAITDTLYDKAVRKQLLGNQANFLKEHIYRHDGKATERVVDLILKMTA